MNDRFKFRAWDKVSKKMNYNNFVVTATGFIGKIEEEFWGQCVFRQDDMTADNTCMLMQCTGLKDKNGVLIYEGDIVKYTSPPSKQHKDERIKPSTINFKVEWVEKFSQYQLQNAAGVNCIHISTAINQLEVIGNIYQNPELLEVENEQ